MKKVAFITLPDARHGFSLAGVTQLITKVEDAGALLKETIAESGIGLVILDERLVEGIGEESLQEIEQEWHGILLTLPAPESPGITRVDYTALMIQRVIGYHLRL
ncbi:MAG: ATPase [Nitrospirae bacterium]|nr:ATPase [Nitrospirota bacterium]